MLKFITIKHSFRNISVTTGNKQNFVLGPKADAKRNVFEDSSTMYNKHSKRQWHCDKNNILDFVLQKRKCMVERETFCYSPMKEQNVPIDRMSVYMITLLFNIHVL